MESYFFIPLTPGGVLLATACVLAGAPLFARGRAAWKLRWRLARPHATYFSRMRGERVDIFADAQKAGILAYMATVPSSLAGEIPSAPTTRPMRMWIGIDPKLGKHGVLAPLPDRLKPSPLHLIFRDLTGARRTLSRDDLRFTLLDFDAY